MARILVIDDDDQVGLMLKDALEEEGHTLLVAENGAVGLDIFQEDAVDLVITDVMMPEKTGIGSLLEIKRISPETPVIVISGNAQTDSGNVLNLATELGASHVLSKPFSIKEMKILIRTVLLSAG